ncbi:hypothetical protein C6502_15325 [Candidatus Poribacteria bacterium]|nr:MAG: hypothetical protein C6502_15325 [Candidatus Poribacteria bacterium]
MNHKQKVGYMALGAVIMLVGLAVGAIVSPPLIAQSNGVFDEIRCSKLTVVDKNGNEGIIVVSMEEGNGVIILDEDGKTAIELSAFASKPQFYPNALVAIAKSPLLNGIKIYDEAGEIKWKAP